VTGAGVEKEPKKMVGKKFVQKETQRKKIHAEEGSHFGIKPV